MLKPLRSVPQRRRQEKRIKLAMAMTIVVLALLLGAVGAGAYYAYIQSQQAPAVVEEPLPTPKAPDIPTTPAPPANNAKVGVSITSISSPVKPGSNALIAIKTLQSSACSVAITYNIDKKVVSDSGLIPKTADEFGVVSWTWTMPGDAQPGNWPVKITCGYKQQSAVVEATLLVE